MRQRRRNVPPTPGKAAARALGLRAPASALSERTPGPACPSQSLVAGPVGSWCEGTQEGLTVPMQLLARSPTRRQGQGAGGGVLLVHPSYGRGRPSPNLTSVARHSHSQAAWWVVAPQLLFRNERQVQRGAVRPALWEAVEPTLWSP